MKVERYIKSRDDTVEVEGAIIAPHDLVGALYKKPKLFRDYFGDPKHWELFWSFSKC